jgi:hypothetical protein
LDGKKIVPAGIVGGVVLFVLLLGTNILMNLIIPYDIALFGGMKAMEIDPVMLLFFLYPFVPALAAAWEYDRIKSTFSGSVTKKGNRVWHPAPGHCCDPIELCQVYVHGLAGQLLCRKPDLGDYRVPAARGSFTQRYGTDTILFS